MYHMCAPKTMRYGVSLVYVAHSLATRAKCAVPGFHLRILLGGEVRSNEAEGGGGRGTITKLILMLQSNLHCVMFQVGN